MTTETTDIRVGIIQRVLAKYRVPFFDRLATQPNLQVSVLAGDPLTHEGLRTTQRLAQAQLWRARNQYLGIGAGSICWQGGIHDWLQRYDPHILVTDANPRLLSSRTAIRWMHQRCRPVLGWGLGRLPRNGPAWLSRCRDWIAKDLLNRLDGVIGYSSKAAQDYVSAGITKDKIFIAHNAIDNSESEHFLERFGTNDTWIQPWKENLNLSSSAPIVLFVGRLLDQKKVELLIDACAPLFPQCQLLVVGDGPQRHAISSHARPHGEFIHLAGHLDGEALAKCFIAADLFVLPGLGGLALHQAMSYGKPVIASFGDGTEADLIREGINGARFESGNASDLRAKIQHLLSDRSRLAAMGKASLAIIRDEMSLDAMVKAFHQALTKTLDSSHGLEH